jgi:hypothetical protein
VVHQLEGERERQEVKKQTKREKAERKAAAASMSKGEKQLSKQLSRVGSRPVSTGTDGGSGVVVGAELAVRIRLVLPEVQQSVKKMMLVQMRVWPPQQHTPLRSLHGMRGDTSCTPRNRKEKEKGAALLPQESCPLPPLPYPVDWLCLHAAAARTL